MAKKVTLKNVEQNSSVDVKFVTADYIAIFFVVAFLAIDFIPYTSGVDNVGIQYLFLALVNLITGIYLFRNPQFISKEYFGLLKKNYAIIAYLLFLTLCGLSIFVSSHYSLSIISFIQLLITFCLFINISILLYNRLHLINSIAFIFIILIFLQCVFEIKKFIDITNSFSLSDAFRQIRGNTGNINIFAANLSTKIPFLLFGIFTFSKFKKWLSIVSLFLAALLILLTGSRASFLGLSIEAIVFIIFLFKINSSNRINFRLLATIVIPLVFAYFTANLLMANANDDSKRFQSVSNRASQIIELDDSSIDKRFSLWGNAVEITKNNPILGIGIGNWQIESIPYEKFIANDLFYSIHPHNDFLEIASETGILNGILFLLIFVFATFINIKRILKNDEPQIKVLSIITLLMIITYGIDSVFNFPLHRPSMQYNLALILAFTLVNMPKINEVNIFTFSKKGILILILVCAGTTFFSYQLYQALLFENEINTDYKLPEAEQTLTSTYIEANMPKYIKVNLSSVPFYELLGKYYLKEKQYEKANSCFNLSEKINPYSGNSDFFRNKIAQEKGLIDSAIIYSKRALETRPRNEIYFYETINTAILKKDTTDILKLHYNFIKYRNVPKYWINTSSALIISKCSYKKAVEFIDEGLKAFPNDASLIERRNSFEFDVLTKKALRLENEKKHLAAIAIYHKILKKDRKNSTALQNMSTCYINLKNYKKAIYYLEKTLEFSTDNDGKFAFRLGVCYYSIENKEKGCSYLNIAVQKNYPNAANIRDKYCQ
jgi:O-antigen ligase/tetratricopeptide (TPR) repeat protein